MDFAYRCYRCGKPVYEFQLIYDPHRCTSCGGHRVEPIMQDLTWFGKWYCEKRNKIGIWWRKVKHEKIENIGF